MFGFNFLSFGLIIGLSVSIYFYGYSNGRNDIIKKSISDNQRIIKTANDIANDIWKNETELQRKTDKIMDIGGLCIDIDGLHAINSIR